jgi:hypothetical protein
MTGTEPKERRKGWDQGVNTRPRTGDRQDWEREGKKKANSPEPRSTAKKSTLTCQR